MSAIDAIGDAVDRAIIQGVVAGFARRATHLRLAALAKVDSDSGGAAVMLRNARCFDGCAADVAALLVDVQPLLLIPSSVAERIPPFNESAL